jgi:hypothetical protein
MQTGLQRRPADAQNNCKINDSHQLYLTGHFPVYSIPEIKTRRGNIMPIGCTTYSDHGVFEPEAVALMGEAFDVACRELASSGQSEEVRELVALLIIAAALRGEIDPLRLLEIVLSELSPSLDTPCVGERQPATPRQSGRPRSIEDGPELGV